MRITPQMVLDTLEKRVTPMHLLDSVRKSACRPHLKHRVSRLVPYCDGKGAHLSSQSPVPTQLRNIHWWACGLRSRPYRYGRSERGVESTPIYPSQRSGLSTRQGHPPRAHMRSAEPGRQSLRDLLCASVEESARRSAQPSSSLRRDRGLQGGYVLSTSPWHLRGSAAGAAGCA